MANGTSIGTRAAYSSHSAPYLRCMSGVFGSRSGPRRPRREVQPVVTRSRRNLTAAVNATRAAQRVQRSAAAATSDDVRLELELEPPDAPSRMPSVEESELEAGFGLAEDSRPGPTGLAEISYTEQRTSASL